MIEYVRLAFGTALVLLPGLAVARALGQRSVSAVLAWTLAALFVAWAVVFAVHASIRVAAALFALIALGGGVLALRRSHLRETVVRAEAWTWVVGLALGGLLWAVEGPVVGDGLFHEGRVRKLVAFGDSACE